MGKPRKLCTTKIFSKLLQAATSSSRWALPGLLSKEIPSSSISTANSDVAKVLELKDSIRSEGHTRNRENYFVKLFSMLKTRKFWSSKIKIYTVFGKKTPNFRLNMDFCGAWDRETFIFRVFFFQLGSKVTNIMWA